MIEPGEGGTLFSSSSCTTCDNVTVVQGVNSVNSFTITYGGMSQSGDFFTFNYTIEKTGRNALSHWSISLLGLGCLTPENWRGFIVSATLNGSDYYNQLVIGTDPTTGITGVKFDNVDYTGVLNFSITFDASKLDEGYTIAKGCVEVATKAGNEDIRNLGRKAVLPGYACIPGPICSEGVPTCETAFAFGGDPEDCFLNNGFNRWGWSNAPLVEGNYEFEIWAAAGQCNLSKGTQVGILSINYSGGTAIVE